jgi:hypothetical protein
MQHDYGKVSWNHEISFVAGFLYPLSKMFMAIERFCNKYNVVFSYNKHGVLSREVVLYFRGRHTPRMRDDIIYSINDWMKHLPNRV